MTIHKYEVKLVHCILAWVLVCAVCARSFLWHICPSLFSVFNSTAV